MRSVALAAIRLYQKYISPYKGFCCAYRVHTGRASCSTLGYRAIRRHGVFGGIALIRSRTHLCGVVHRRQSSHPLGTLHPQRGGCDFGCDLPCDPSCDLPVGRFFSGICDFVNCCDCGSCDWPDRRRKKAAKDEQYVYIPPRMVKPLPPGFPLLPTDARGNTVRVGSAVTVLSVASCLTGLPLEDQQRLQAIVGQVRYVVRFDVAGFVWLGFSAGDLTDDFCLFPTEVALA
jgi:putative component of membrane protein insertase Oxa1/YidC/SpoIIIJ protein YidD